MAFALLRGGSHHRRNAGSARAGRSPWEAIDFCLFCQSPAPASFPPRTREVQADERWGFVANEGANCDPADPLDRPRGDDRDHTAVDPESRLLLALVPGKRDGATCERPIRQVHDRTGGRTDVLPTSDEHAP